MTQTQLTEYVESARVLSATIHGFVYVQRTAVSTLSQVPTFKISTAFDDDWVPVAEFCNGDTITNNAGGYWWLPRE